MSSLLNSQGRDFILNIKNKIKDGFSNNKKEGFYSGGILGENAQMNNTINRETEITGKKVSSLNSNISNYNGSYNGSFITGKFNSALDCGTAAPYGLVTTLVSNSNTISHSFWVNFKDFGGAAYFSLVTNSANSGGSAIPNSKYHILWDSGNNYFIVSVGNGSGWSDTNLTPSTTNAVSQYHGVNAWQHMVVVLDNGNIKIYLNTDLIINASFPIGNQTTSNYVGYGTYGPSSRTETFDQIRIYNKALSADNVATLYNETVATASTNLSLDLVGLYSGTPTNVNFLGMAFQPDLVWLKGRDTAGKWNVWYDSIRGATKMISSNETNAETTYGSVTMDSNGFTLGTGFGDGNTNGENYVAWAWKAGGAAVSNTDGTITSQVSANQDAGFSIVSYTGTLTSAGNISVGHGLSSAPELIISKRTDSAGAWRIRPFFLNNNPYDYLEFDTGALAQFSSSDGAMSLPTSTTFDNNWNSALGGAGDVIAYCFHSVDGYQKVGSYTGTGTTLQTIVTGFRPRFILIKNTTDGNVWTIGDSVRNPNNPVDKALFPNLANAEYTYPGTPNGISFVSNGFTLNTNQPEFNQSSGGNNNPGTYIYLAIA